MFEFTEQVEKKAPFWFLDFIFGLNNANYIVARVTNFGPKCGYFWVFFWGPNVWIRQLQKRNGNRSGVNYRL